MDHFGSGFNHNAPSFRPGYSYRPRNQPFGQPHFGAPRHFQPRNGPRLYTPQSFTGPRFGDMGQIGNQHPTIQQILESVSFSAQFETG